VNDLVARVVGLCRALRGRGLLVTTAHSADALRALRSVGVHSRDQVYWALRCVLAARPEDFAVFDELFWRLFAPPGSGAAGSAPAPRPAPRAPEDGASKGPVSLSSWLGQDALREGEAEPQEVPAASDREALSRKDVASFGDEDLAEIERIAARLARRLAARPSRRWKAARRGSRVDLRRTVRRSLSSAAEPLELCFRRRKPRKTRIVALCDVSGSMDIYSRFLLQFLYALQGSMARVESFVFATTLRRVTEALRERPYAGALRGLGAEASDWSGGTRIGASVEAFNQDWRRLVDRRTVVVLLSDGWETGDPALLGEQLELLKSRCRRLIWLNPLLGSEGYEPLTQGMQAALPHVSVFAPAHNLASLRALERHLLA
jgi:uncharacterized protein with von Willebrand factor type A (vWA) domain